ncbi:UNVERIFIED_CONTAM: hypothetical protein K2H54_003789 [Gekko kuhli]
MTERKASSHTRKTSKMKGDDYVFLTEKQMERDPAERSTSVEADCSIQVSSRNIRMSGGASGREAKGWKAEPLSTAQGTATRARENEVPSLVFKRQHSEETEGRKGTLRRQITRSDSESSVENRQVNKLTLNSPVDENKARPLSWVDSKEARNEEMDFLPVQSKQETGGQLATVPSDQRGDFTQLVDCVSGPDSVPDCCHVVLTGAEDSAEETTADRDKVAKGLEIKVSAALNFALVSEEAEKRLRQSDSRSPESGEDFGICDEMGAVSDSNSHAGCLQTPDTEPQHPGESPKPTAAMLVTLMNAPNDGPKEGVPSKAAADEPAEDADTILQGQREKAGSQEDEKALKVADVKKTFEKRKPEAGKATPPARKGEMGMARSVQG